MLTSLLLTLACSDTALRDGTGNTIPRVLTPLADDHPAPVDEDLAIDAAQDTGRAPPATAPPALRINEVLSDNRYALRVGDLRPDYVELYNASGETIALGRVALVDRSGVAWTGTDGELAPGAFLLLLTDGAATPTSLPFGLSNDGDRLELSVDGTVVDRIATGPLDDDISWSRFPDGGEWAPTRATTPGETNGRTPDMDSGPRDVVYDFDDVHQLDLDADPGDYATIESRVYAPMDMTLDGDTITDVGGRLRGSMTYCSLSSKAAFKIDVNRFVDQRFLGQENFNVLNMYWEASYMREYFAYAIFRAFDVPAARNSYAWMRFGGVDYGLYLISETYDDTFLRNWYGSDNGYLWEPEYGDFSSAMSAWDCEEGACDATTIQPILTYLDQSATDANVAALEEHLDLDEALRLIAGELAMGQWDGYCAIHNYRVYHNLDTGIAQMIPSSLDLTFDNLGDYGTDFYSCGGRLLSWCRSNTGCAERYDQTLLDLADLVETMDVATMQDEIEARIEPYVDADLATRSQYTRSQVDAQQDYLRSYLANLPAEIRRQVAAH